MTGWRSQVRSFSLAFVLCMSAGLTLGGQAGKKVFIPVDMEGISGISGSDQLSAAGAEYGRSRKLRHDRVLGRHDAPSLHADSAAV
jgi:D-aminopeptidase